MVMHVDAITRRLNHLSDFVQVAMGTYQALVNEAHGHNLDIKSIKRRLELGMNAVGHRIEMWPLPAWTKKMSRTIGCIVRKVN